MSCARISGGQGRAAFVGDPGLDVERYASSSNRVIFSSGGGPVRIDGRQPGGPAEEEQRPVSGVVVGVLMRDENRAQIAERQLCERHLARHSVAAVHEVDSVADNDRLRRRGADDFRRRTTGGTKENQPSARRSGRSWRLAASDRRPQQRGAGSQKRAACHVCGQNHRAIIRARDRALSARNWRINLSRTHATWDCPLSIGG